MLNSRWQRWFMFRPWQRHSLVLMVGGLVYIAVGVSFLTIGEPSVRQTKTIAVALQMAPLRTWGLVFIFSGSLAAISSKWPSFSETWGYMVLCGLSAGWGSVYFLGIFMTGAVPSINLPAGFVWLLMSFMWWAVSGLLNPERLAEVVEEVLDGPD